jgi:hypothetical protein
MRWARLSTLVLRFHFVVGRGAVMATRVLATYPIGSLLLMDIEVETLSAEYSLKQPS